MELQLRPFRIYGKCAVDGCKEPLEDKKEFRQVIVNNEFPLYVSLCEQHAALAHYPPKAVFKINFQASA